MRKLLRLGVVVALAASGMIVTASASSASITVVECDPPPIDNPGVDNVPVLGTVLGDQDPCAELTRTLVFVGTAALTNSVNFAGTGTGAAGGDFAFKAADATDPLGCMVVDWETPEASSVPEAIISDCNFSTTVGEYHNPSQPNPIINPIGAGLEGGCFTPSSDYCGLDWAPASQASCINSSGSGTSSFSSSGLDGTPQTWSAEYTWTNSLDNLRGSVWFGTPSDRGSAVEYDFDAKIQTQADPFHGPPEDRTAAGCLQKTANALLGAGPNQASDVGLDSVLVVGTATWRSTVPTILG